MTVEFKFASGEYVAIKPLDGLRGRVLGACISWGDAMPRYDVRYFHNGESYLVWFSEDELDAL